MSTETIQFKHKPQGSREKWEDLPVVQEFNIDRRNKAFHQIVNTTIRGIFKRLGAGEVRWNWKGSQQGHYKRRG